MRGGMLPLQPMVIEGMTPAETSTSASDSAPAAASAPAPDSSMVVAEQGQTLTQTKATNLSVPPVEMTEAEAGGPQKAYQATMEREARQAAVNKTFRGGARSRRRHRSKKRTLRRLRYRKMRLLRGGVAPLNPAPLTSPQFPGGTGPQSATATAYKINQTYLDSQAQSTNDKLVNQ